ncbi:glycosyl transferase family 2 [Chitinophaga skermanii]|uniref:Glycosyl transferase family 2 n=1 Tax=Chitinophaga skermanii TaxID=331697 RepID=A0A327QPQ2_9BACT|nr:glycosyltransferase [Chitinophaga skermanii]RAJ06559.1 glycosyl transferase family 2 [Chitinophaga skermanii]
MYSIDIIIPSFRLEEKYLLPILLLPAPKNTTINIFVIVDNPAATIPPQLEVLAQQPHIHLHKNPENLGAGATRNRGIELGKGDWILFLDDDITVPQDLLQVYANAIQENPGEIGFIGLVNLPTPSKPFTRAVITNGGMDIFTIAKHKPYFKWGATANIMVKRAAVGNHRFANEYPKAGGGEDVDFFMHICDSTNKQLKTLPEAAVEHPWWTNESVGYTRPIRYGTGTAILMDRMPQYAYWDLLNTLESLVVAFIALIVTMFTFQQWHIPILLFMVGMIFTDYIANYVQYRKRAKSGNLVDGYYMTMLRFANDWGVLKGKIAQGKWYTLGRRFHDNGKVTKIHIHRTNTFKIVKWVCYLVLGILIYQMCC